MDVSALFLLLAELKNLNLNGEEIIKLTEYLSKNKNIFAKEKNEMLIEIKQILQKEKTDA